MTIIQLYNGKDGYESFDFQDIVNLSNKTIEELRWKIDDLQWKVFDKDDLEAEVKTLKEENRRFKNGQTPEPAPSFTPVEKLFHFIDKEELFKLLARSLNKQDHLCAICKNELATQNGFCSTCQKRHEGFIELAKQALETLQGIKAENEIKPQDHGLTLAEGLAELNKFIVDPSYVVVDPSQGVLTSPMWWDDDRNELVESHGDDALEFRWLGGTEQFRQFLKSILIFKRDSQQGLRRYSKC